MILLDSNVLIAAIIETHPHHAASVVLAEVATAQTVMVAAHSLVETYSTITRANLPYRVSGAAASNVVDRLTENMTIAALTLPQILDAIRRFSGLGTGPRLYDFLIGLTGEIYGAHTIVTWNTRDFEGLFPRLRIVTPAAL